MTYYYGLIEDHRVPPELLKLAQSVARDASQRLPMPGVVEVWPMAKTTTPRPDVKYLFSSDHEVPSIGNVEHGAICLDLTGTSNYRSLVLQVASDVFQMAEEGNHQTHNQTLANEFARKVARDFGY